MFFFLRDWSLIIEWLQNSRGGQVKFYHCKKGLGEGQKKYQL